MTPPYKSSSLLARPEPRCSSGLLFNPPGSPEFRSPYVSFASRCTRTARTRRVKNSNSFLLLLLLLPSPILQPVQLPSLRYNYPPDVNLYRAPGMATRLDVKKIHSCGGIERGVGKGLERAIFFFFSKILENRDFPKIWRIILFFSNFQRK